MGEEMSNFIQIKDTIINLDYVISIYFHKDHVSFVTTANKESVGEVITKSTREFIDIPSALTEKELKTLKQYLTKIAKVIV
jgi:hypothetical protein